MVDHELTYEEALQGLNELFGGAKAPPTRSSRKYVLEYQDGEPVFRFAQIVSSHSTLPRSELDVAFDEVIVELFGPDPDGGEIVPEKLAEHFPGSSFEPVCGLRSECDGLGNAAKRVSRTQTQV
jgi:hypothetical protein